MNTADTRRFPVQSDAGWLAPGARYASLDHAMHAASCLAGLHPSGATIFGTTNPAHADPDSGESYMIACEAVRTDGTTWTAPGGPFTPEYTITRCR